MPNVYIEGWPNGRPQGSAIEDYVMEDRMDRVLARDGRWRAPFCYSTRRLARRQLSIQDAAKSAGLRYVSDARPGIRRKKAGKGFTYTRADGSKLSESEVLKRIQALAIPPA